MLQYPLMMTLQSYIGHALACAVMMQVKGMLAVTTEGTTLRTPASCIKMRFPRDECQMDPGLDIVKTSANTFQAPKITASLWRLCLHTGTRQHTASKKRSPHFIAKRKGLEHRELAIDDE